MSNTFLELLIPVALVIGALIGYDFGRSDARDEGE